MKNKKIGRVYEEKGGVRVGESYWFSSNYTWPLAKILIFKKKVTIKYGSSKIEFRKDEINYIKKYKGLFSKGIRVYHKRKTHSFIIFWSSSVDNLINKLKNEGYKIK